MAGYLGLVVERRLFGGGSGMDMEGFRDKADDAITQGEEEVDERTGGRFDEQTDRAADEARERGEGILGDQQGDEPQQEFGSGGRGGVRPAPLGVRARH